MRFGLYVGDDAITSTAPVFGFTSTAAPHFPARSDSARRCAFASRFSVTLFPVIVAPLRLAPSLSKSVPRFASEAVRNAFCVRSMPARDRPWVE
jgi:hypothetical protein